MSSGLPPGLGGSGDGGDGSSSSANANGWSSSNNGRRQASSSHRAGVPSMSGAPPGLLHNATGAQSPSGNNNNNSSLITIVKAQISFLLSTLTDANFTKNKQDIAQVRFLTFSARILMPRIANSCSSSPCSVLPPCSQW